MHGLHSHAYKTVCSLLVGCVLYCSGNSWQPTSMLKKSLLKSCNWKLFSCNIISVHRAHELLSCAYGADSCNLIWMTRNYKASLVLVDLLRSWFDENWISTMPNNPRHLYHWTKHLNIAYIQWNRAFHLSNAIVERMRRTRIQMQKMSWPQNGVLIYRRSRYSIKFAHRRFTSCL